MARVIFLGTSGILAYLAKGLGLGLGLGTEIGIGIGIGHLD
jgi:hypothetical protein